MMYRFPDFPGIGQQPPPPPGGQPQMMQSPSPGQPGGQMPYSHLMNQGFGGMSQGFGQQMPFDGIGMMSMLMPMLMGMMQPGVGGMGGAGMMGGFQGIGSQPQSPQAPPPIPRMIGAGMTAPSFSPQPTGGINRGTFPF